MIRSGVVLESLFELGWCVWVCSLGVFTLFVSTFQEILVGAVVLNNVWVCRVNSGLEVVVANTSSP